MCLGFYASVALREGLEENSALCKQFKRVLSKSNAINLWWLDYNSVKREQLIVKRKNYLIYGSQFQDLLRLSLTRERRVSFEGSQGGARKSPNRQLADTKSRQIN